MQTIVKNEGGNFGEIKSISIALQENILNVSLPNGDKEISVTFSSGEWGDIYFTPQTDSYKCNFKESKGNGYYDLKLSFSTPKIRADVVKAAKSYIGKKLLVKFTDKNNTSYLIGDKRQFALLEAEPVIKSKNNAVEFTIISKLSDFPYFLANS